MTAKLPLDSNYDMEQQFILRMTDTLAAQNLAADIEAGIPFKENFTIEFKPDMRHTIVRYNGQVYQGQIMDLPCIIESLKTTDKKNFYKTADICQMMICTQGDETGPLRGTAAYLDNRPGSRNKTFEIGHENREFQYLHGITPPLKNVLHRRFRKTRRKRFVDMPKIEKEVKQLLRADLEAVNVKWEVIWTDPPAPIARANAGNKSGASNAAESGDANGQLGNQNPTADDEVEDEDEDGTRAYAIDHRDVFGEISSSSLGSSSDSDDSSGSSHAGDRDRRNSHRRGQAGSSGHPSDNENNENNPQSSSAAGDNNEKSKGQTSTQNQNSESIVELPQSSSSSSSSSTNAYNKRKSALIPTTTTTVDDISTGVPLLSDSNNNVNNNNNNFGSLKDELAAELLLSDSGDENDDIDNDDNNNITYGIGGGGGHGDGDDDDDDDGDLQTSAVAELVANSSSNLNASNMGGLNESSLHRIGSIVGTDLDDLDVVVDEDDEDNIIHRGGELLDDSAFMGFTSSTATTTNVHGHRTTTTSTTTPSTIDDYHSVVFNADLDDLDNEDTL